MENSGTEIMKLRHEGRIVSYVFYKPLINAVTPCVHMQVCLCMQLSTSYRI
jgi:hypothetical protein